MLRYNAVGRPAQRNGGAAMADSSSGVRTSAPSWWRFSLKQLLTATAIVALGCVALRSANATWIGAMFGLVWLTLAASLLLAVYRDGQSRAFWVGFALVGWLYLLTPWFGSSIGSGLHPDYLVTSRLSHRAHDWLYPQPAYPPGGYGGMMGGMSMGPGGPGMDGGSGYGSAMGGYGSSDAGMAGSGEYGSGSPGGMPGMPGMGSMMCGMSPGGPPVPVVTGPSLLDFTNVSHALWTLLLASCGGWFAQWLYASRERSRNAAV